MRITTSCNAILCNFGELISALLYTVDVLCVTAKNILNEEITLFAKNKKSKYSLKKLLYYYLSMRIKRVI